MILPNLGGEENKRGGFLKIFLPLSNPTELVLNKGSLVERKVLTKIGMEPDSI